MKKVKFIYDKQEEIGKVMRKLKGTKAFYTKDNAVLEIDEAEKESPNDKDRN